MSLTKHVQVICDQCGEVDYAVSTGSYEKARKQLKITGWVFSNFGDFCSWKCRLTHMQSTLRITTND